MDHYYWFALRAVPLVGNVLFLRLLHKFDSPEKVLAASPDELAEVKGISPSVIASLAQFDYRPVAERECREVEKWGVRVIDFLSAEYPKSLLEIPDPPPFLYARGRTAVAIDPAIAVVGSRNASPYGMGATEKLSRQLAEQGIGIISGMARGIDTAAHRGALAVGGRTVGVLGCGIDVVYPPEGRRLFDDMLEKGAIVSEFPMGTTPLAENFPRRNRLISGLSRGVLVVEAVEKSGSLITARYALDQGREVFAVPGTITARGSKGPNQLIKQGAKLVDSIEDILEELPAQFPAREGASPSFSLTPSEARIYNLLADSPLHIDEIAVRTDIGMGEIAGILLHLELKGAISQLPGKYFALT